jgi:hypothetical protein
LPHSVLCTSYIEERKPEDKELVNDLKSEAVPLLMMEK